MSKHNYRKRHSDGVREYNIISKLPKHKNIISILDFYRNKVDVAIVFKHYVIDFYDYLENETFLNEKLAKVPYPIYIG